MSEAVNNFLNKYIHLSDSNVLYFSSKDFERNKKNSVKDNFLVNLELLNNIRYLNKYFESVNEAIDNGTLLFGRVETYSIRKKNIFSSYPKLIAYFIHLFQIFFHRLLPRIKFIKNIYFFITKGKGKLISKAEILGRLYCCGFELIELKVIDDKLNFIVKKIKKPSYDMNPTYGLIIGLNRLGKNRKKIKVYKFRTMHPYSEYLQKYLFRKSNLDVNGKVKNDFRISREGAFLRRYWIDELPMIFNILKGDIKLIGVRPISEDYFVLYSDELKKIRTKYKPGFIPPYYVDLPKNLDEIIVSELKYFKLYEKNPIKTDFIYLIKALNNVFFRGVRSK